MSRFNLLRARVHRAPEEYGTMYRNTLGQGDSLRENTTQ